MGTIINKYYWLVSYEDGRTFIVGGEDLYDVNEQVNSDFVISVTRLSKELIKRFVIEKIES